MRTTDWNNPKVREGMKRMLDLRSLRIEAGERPIGWKLGFGAPASLSKFGLSGPLVGFVTDANLHPSGAVVSVEGWHNPVAEPEIAVQIGEDVSLGSGRVAEAIAGVAAAIELADVHPPPEDIVDVLGGNIFHRAVITDIDRSYNTAVSDLRGRVELSGLELVETSDVEALTGDVVSVIGHCADLLALAGAGLRAGEVVIAGSIIPPVALEPGNEVRFELAPLPEVSVEV